MSRAAKDRTFLGIVLIGILGSVVVFLFGPSTYDLKPSLCLTIGLLMGYVARGWLLK